MQINLLLSKYKSRNSLYSKYDFPNQQFTDLLIPVLKEDYYNAFVSGDELDLF